MGNFLSRTDTMACDSPGSNVSPNNCEKMETNNDEISESSEVNLFESTNANVQTNRSKEMEEFKKDLAIKRAQRREILARHAEEKENLKKSLELEKEASKDIQKENQYLKELLRLNNIEYTGEYCPTPLDEVKDSLDQLKEGLDDLRDQNKKLRRDLAESNFSLQSANADIANLNYQNVESMKQISALKEVIAVSKTMMNIREGQLNELRDKLKQIEASLADREASTLSSDLRQEYERQLQNIRSLRSLYEERARLAEVTRLHLLRELEEEKVHHLAEVNRCIALTAKVDELEAKVNEMTETLDSKNDQISSTKHETQGLKAEMLTVNKLFSQMLLGFNNRQDLDKLVTRLEENHGILSHMVLNENSSETSSALPRLLLELVNQIDEKTDKENDENTKDYSEVTITTAEKDEVADTMLNTTAKEIVDNLPKVWRVLMELLSHQTMATEATASSSTCYKSVETPSGSVLVPSVSQTYIRLKDLIVEKLSLVKEVKKMKRLNSHLETRLEEQERRLCLVTSELSKTWHVVGRLRRHHHQLHTHEKILRYELQQKRKMLSELREELEYCKEKWDKAREKNHESEKEWKKLRAEFSSRRTKNNTHSFNNSAESGYSDDRHTESSESNDESEYLSCSRIVNKPQKTSNDGCLDSIADSNLVAEREDPISDLLDVSELPLDSQDLDTSGIVSCDESQVIEPDMVTACEDSLTEDSGLNSTDNDIKSAPDYSAPTRDRSLSSDDSGDISIHNELLSTTNTVTDIKSYETQQSNSQLNAQNHVINPTEILESIKRQNERLAKRDLRMKELEESAKNLIDQSSRTVNITDELSKRMDQIHETSTKKSLKNAKTSSDAELTDTFDSKEGSPSTSQAFQDQEERYRARDERLKRLEEQAKSLVSKVRGTKDKRIKIKYKLEELHNIYRSDSASRNESPSRDDDVESNDCSISDDLPNEESLASDHKEEQTVESERDEDINSNISDCLTNNNSSMATTNGNECPQSPSFTQNNSEKEENNSTKLIGTDCQAISDATLDDNNVNNQPSSSRNGSEKYSLAEKGGRLRPDQAEMSSKNNKTTEK